MIQLLHGECLEEMKTLEDNSVDSIVTDPPYGLSFMGKKWDYDVPSEEVWRECLRVLKPGGYLLSFAGTRTQHRMAVRIEDAGFEVRDMIAWVYGSGFPKSLNIGKAVDKLQGNERTVVGRSTTVAQKSSAIFQSFNGAEGANLEDIDGNLPLTKGTSPYEGWGTALKPALEPITVARKPLIGTVAENVLTYGTGGINIDGCRVGTEGGGTHCDNRDENGKCLGHNNAGRSTSSETFHGADTQGGRFPANLIHDGSEEVVGLFPETNRIDRRTSSSSSGKNLGVYGAYRGGEFSRPQDNGGNASRFFYCAKSSRKDRGEGNSHPTVKPTDLMRYLCRLVTPKGGTVLDPFMGSGSTGKGAVLEGFNFIGIEREKEYMDIATARIAQVQSSVKQGRGV